MSVKVWTSNALSERKKEQWFCPRNECDAGNYLYRSACRRCNYPRQGMILPITKRKAGDWYCHREKCFELNFGNRQTCRLCGIFKQAEVPEKEMKKYP